MQANWGQAASIISGGEPDAVVLPELFPGSRLVTVGAAGKMTGWSMPKDVYEGEAMQKYMQAPGSAPVLMDLAALRETMGPDWTFISEDDKFRALATIGGDVVHKDMDEQLVYDLVSAYVATVEDLKAKAPFGNTVNFDNQMLGMCGANPIKYHPGAARAWREAGYQLDDCAVAD